MPFPESGNIYLSATAEGEALGLVALEFRCELIGADGGNAFVLPDTDVFSAVTERSGPAAAGTGNVVDAVAAAWGHSYRARCRLPKRSVLGKENFCLEDDVFSECCERSSSAIHN